MDPAFWLAFPLDGEPLFLFIYENLILESLLIFVLFLKSKQNKKETPYLENMVYEKTGFEFRC